MVASAHELVHVLANQERALELILAALTNRNHFKAQSEPCPLQKTQTTVFKNEQILNEVFSLCKHPFFFKRFVCRSAP
jgi:hypothetical protein